MSIVSISRCDPETVEAAVRQTVNRTEAFDSFDWKNSRVLIKPNTVNPSQAGSGMVTDARIVETVTSLVMEKTPKASLSGKVPQWDMIFPDVKIPSTA